MKRLSTNFGSAHMFAILHAIWLCQVPLSQRTEKQWSAYNLAARGNLFPTANHLIIIGYR